MTASYDTKEQIATLYINTRRLTQDLCQPLATEDYVIQSVPDVSPPKWHLAHTTWFFETFILAKFLSDYQPFDKMFHHLFNSYYHGVGRPFPREKRGLLSRPTVATIYSYRKKVDENLLQLISHISEHEYPLLHSLITLGIHHEQQHQELLLMDIKHNLSLDPNFPVYQKNKRIKNSHNFNLSFTYLEGGMVEIGHKDDSFCFDNELPKHQQFLQPYQLATRLVTNAEFLEFMEAGAYHSPQWWLSDGWDCVLQNRWESPLYWLKRDDNWYLFTLSGLQKIDLNEPVSHVSYYEADAYARWRGYRLPLESEWEHFVNNNNKSKENPNFLERGIYHPLAANQNAATIPQQFLGDLWEWTASPYSPYPGFKPLSGALGEYNGKFMSNQTVLRGGSCATPSTHIRTSYRNFFQPDKRWQFSGIRLAADAV